MVIDKAQIIKDIKKKVSALVWLLSSSILLLLSALSSTTVALLSIAGLLKFNIPFIAGLAGITFICVFLCYYLATKAQKTEKKIDNLLDDLGKNSHKSDKTVNGYNQVG